jgi:hypothetical protein
MAGIAALVVTLASRAPLTLAPKKMWWRGNNFATLFMPIEDIDLMRTVARFTR